MVRYEDWDLWISLDEKGQKGLFVDKILFFTHAHRQGRAPVKKEDSGKWIKILSEKHGVDPDAKIADIVIPHHDRHDLLKQCLDHLDNKLFNIIIVSGGSFSKNCNKGAKLAETENIIFLNDDTIPDNEILKEMAYNKADIVGVAQTIPSISNRKVFYGIGYYKKGDGLKANLTENLDDPKIPSGYCFKVNKKVWCELGGLSEDFINGGEDQDLAFRAIEGGYSIDYVEKPMIHILSQSEGRFYHSRDNEKLINKMYPAKRIIKILNL